MNKKAVRILFVILSLAITAAAQVNLNAPVPTDPNVKIGKLENGLTYYIRKNSKPANKVELRLAVNVGSIVENEDQQGLAHFLEHMAFNGTKNFKKNELVSYLQSIGVRFGADLNAYTSFDETVYILPIPTDKPELIDKGLTVLSDWASAIDLDAEEINKERGVVLEELRLGTGAGQRMRDKYFPLLFKGSQYAERLPIGKAEVLKNFDRKTLVDFYETWYRPDLMAVIAVGDIDVAEMEKKIKENFSGIKAKREKKERKFYPVPDHKETLIAIETDKEAPLTSAQILFKKPEQKTETLADLRQGIIKSFFNGMLNARLDEIRQSPNPPFAFGASSFGSLTRTKDSYSMFGGTDPENIKKTLAVLLEENKRVKEYGFTKGEFERQKQEYLTRLENQYKERDKTESNRLVNSYVYHFFSDNPITGIEFEYDFAQKIVPTITLEEINALAKETTSDENRVVIITGAVKPDGIYPSKKEVAELLDKADSLKVEPYVDKVDKTPLVENLETKATIKETNFDKKFGITTWTLSNGIKVYLQPTEFQADQILLRSFSPGGRSLVSDEEAFSATFVSSIVNQSGLKNLSKIQLGKKLAGNTAEISVSLSENYEYVNGSSTPKDFETLLQLTYLTFTNVNFDKETFNSFINQQKIFLPNLISDPQFYFSEEVNKIMTQNHPRAFKVPTAEKLNQADFEQVKTIYNERFGDASDFTFVIIGNFEVEKIKPQILKYLGSLPTNNRTEKWKDLGIRPPKTGLKKVINRGVDQKSQVQITFTGDTKYSLQEHRNMIYLADLLTIKLVEILREEKSGVYGVGARGSVDFIPYERYYFNISFPAGPENVDSLIEAAFGEIEKIKKGQIEDKDLDKVKEGKLVNVRENFKRNEYVANEISRSLLRNEPMYNLEETEARIKAIDKKDLQRVANKYLKKGSDIQIILMPATKMDK
ncbi:MAG: insulinase family protein [Acidobacteriota bacterium]|nr:insulinase family protein [Acidobacteriota bacterium]